MAPERDADSEVQLQLERRVHGALRSLPLRRAPEDLAARVLEQLGRRAALPWWRRQVAHWPAFARLLFALVAAALIGVSLAGSVHLPSLAQHAAPAMAWTSHAVALARAVAGLLAVLIRAVPTGWLEAGIALGACAYLFLFGLSAAAYRLLYLQR